MAKRRDARLNELTASEIARAVRDREVRAEDVARACLERVAEREPAVEAWQCYEPEHVLAQARAVDRGPLTGALAGVPFGAKDIFDTADLPTEYGSPIYRGHRPRADAACIALTRKAGGVLFGKTVTTEFANFTPGKTRNPFDPARTPGGSSSGSGAAVGDDMVPLALGTQTTASTIRPAAYCGAVGYRPTFGDLRTVGIKEAAGSLDTPGIIARSIADVSLYRDVLLDVPHVPVSPRSSAPRIGFCRTHLWKRLDAHTQALLEGAASRLAAAGATVRDVALPAAFEAIESIHRDISSFEFSRNFTWEVQNHGQAISERLRNGRLADGAGCTFERYRDARRAASALRAMLDDVFSAHDVLLTAAVTGEAPLGLAATGDPSQCLIWTTAYVPAITLPVFRGPNGLPVGAQLVARRDADRDLFAAAEWVWAALR